LHPDATVVDGRMSHLLQYTLPKEYMPQAPAGAAGAGVAVAAEAAGNGAPPPPPTTKTTTTTSPTTRTRKWSAVSSKRAALVVHVRPRRCCGTRRWRHWMPLPRTSPLLPLVATA